MAVVVEWDTPDKTGASKREHLTQVKRSAPEVDIPQRGSHVWAWFWDLSAARGSGGFAPNPLSAMEVATWAGLMKIELQEWEFKALRAMDAAFLAAVAKLKP